MVDEKTGNGGWGNDGERCRTARGNYNMGGPVATFRWDGANEVDIKNFSVREIQPTTK